MNQALELLDRALETARREMRALAARDYELAAELHADRAQLVQDAWNLRTAVPVEVYRHKLNELSELQKSLMRTARDARDIVRASLQHTHRQQKRLGAYQKCLRMAF